MRWESGTGLSLYLADSEVRHLMKPEPWAGALEDVAQLPYVARQLNSYNHGHVAHYLGRLATKDNVKNLYRVLLIAACDMMEQL